MIRRYLIPCAALGAALALSACGGSEQDFTEMASAPPIATQISEMRAPAPMMAAKASDMAMRAGRDAISPPPPPEEGAGPVAQSGPMLAYSHNRTIEVAPKDVGVITASHQKICEAAGPSTCMVVSASQQGLGESWANASLFIKATPAWVEGFLEGLPSSLSATHGRITEASTYAEDLSTSIIDTDARLKAKLTLRDRLQGLLTDRPSELGDLLDLERELARVQADIDSTASVLAALRQRVALSDLRLHYTARQTPGSASVWRPLGDAFGSFFSHFAGALAAIVTTIAVILPWIPVVIGLIWLARALWRRVFRKKQPVSKP